MFFNDHEPPHFHAYYGSDEALVAIETLSVFAGRLPPRAMGLVVEWASLHQPPGRPERGLEEGEGSRVARENRAAPVAPRYRFHSAIGPLE
ncbi:MAG: DUF4160 domain-containing protein [Vicinamibacteria bacterium]